MTYWLYQGLLASAVLGGLCVMTSRSPITAVLCLIAVYLAGGGMFLLLDHPFLGLTLVLVYVGAIAILFLFTVFMINLRADTGSHALSFRHTALLLPAAGAGLVWSTGTPSDAGLLFLPDWSHLLVRPHELHVLGDLLFNTYPLALLLVAYLLLVVMVAIVALHLDA